MKEEIVGLKSIVSGKDEAIKALGANLLEKATEHANMSEMVTNFKNKLIGENCFHQMFACPQLFAVLACCFRPDDRLFLHILKCRRRCHAYP